MNQLTERQKGWLAGVIEGEGHFSIPNQIKKPRNSRIRGSLVVSMTDQDVIVRLQEITGTGTIFFRKTQLNRKDAYTWTVGKRSDLMAIICEITEDLCDRRKEASLDLLDKLSQQQERALVKMEILRETTTAVMGLYLSGRSQAAIARELEISSSRVHRIIRNKNRSMTDA